MPGAVLADGPALKAVALVGADKVHAANQRGLVSGCAYGVGQVGSTELRMWSLPQTWLALGRRPVIKAMRAGTHKGEGVYALAKRMPSLAKRLRCGVRTSGSP